MNLFSLALQIIAALDKAKHHHLVSNVLKYQGWEYEINIRARKQTTPETPWPTGPDAPLA